MPTNEISSALVAAFAEATKDICPDTKLVVVKDKSFQLVFRRFSPIRVQVKFVRPNGEYLSLVRVRSMFGVTFAVGTFDSNDECIDDNFYDSVEEAEPEIQAWFEA